MPRPRLILPEQTRETNLLDIRDARTTRNGFELGSADEQSMTRVANQRYLMERGWWGEIESMPNRPLFIEEDPHMRKSMERLRDEVFRALNFQKIMTEPMLVSPYDLPQVTGEVVDRHIRDHIKSYTLLVQSVYYTANGDRKRGAQAYDEAIRQARDDYPKFVGFSDDWMKSTMDAIRKLNDAHLRQHAEPEYAEYIRYRREQYKEMDKWGLLGLLTHDCMSDDIYLLGNSIYWGVDRDYARSRSILQIGLGGYDSHKPARHTTEEFAKDLAFIDLATTGARGVDILRPLVGAAHSSFSEFAKAQAAQDSPYGRGLRAHFEKVREER